MHELALAEAILELVLEQADGRRVVGVGLRVGRLRQVVAPALTFGFELTAQGTPAEGAVLAIEDVPVVGRCRACGVESELPTFPLQCRGCAGLDLEVLQGEELLVEWFEVDECAADVAVREGGQDHGGNGEGETAKAAGADH